MATANRPGFVRQALRCFVRQTYRNKELIVVDDGDRPVQALCRDVPGVRYLRLTQPATTGAKMNLGIESARGSIIHKLDDDDFYHPDFLATSVANLPPRDREAILVTRCCFLVLLRGDPLLRHSGHGWRPGGAFVFDRAMWRRIPFREVPRSEDSWFLRDHEPEIVRICRTEEYMVVRHGANTWKSMTTGDADDYFRACPIYEKALSEVVPREDLSFYRSLVG